MHVHGSLYCVSGSRADSHGAELRSCLSSHQKSAELRSALFAIQECTATKAVCGAARALIDGSGGEQRRPAAALAVCGAGALQRLAMIGVGYSACIEAAAAGNLALAAGQAYRRGESTSAWEPGTG